MARLPRIVIPDVPHHITQRGNRRQQTFFEAQDYHMYLGCLQQASRQYKVRIWNYCLMPNHIHIIAVPETQDSLAKAIGRTHETYTRYINFKMGWRGYLWQGRFHSMAMDQEHTYHAIKYVELNPLQAQLVKAPEHYLWSSSHIHLGLAKNHFLDIQAVKALIGNWHDYLAEGVDTVKIKLLEKHLRTGRPLGSRQFISKLEEITQVPLHRKKPGPKINAINKVQSCVPLITAKKRE